jgi:hypothetical protein
MRSADMGKALLYNVTVCAAAGGLLGACGSVVKEPSSAMDAFAVLATPTGAVEEFRAAGHICPAQNLSVASGLCDNTPDEHGRQTRYPLEWGDGGRGELWYGRILCPNGEIAETERVGNLGAAPTVSSAERSPIGERLSTMGSSDVLDVWVVHCSGLPDQEWVLNLYRCGNPCPPSGYGLVNERAFQIYRQAVTAVVTNPALVEQPDFAKSIQDALDDDPRVNMLHLLEALVAIQVGDFAEGRRILAHILQRNPSNINYYAALDRLEQLEGNPGGQVVALRGLLEHAGEHPERHEWRCRYSRALRMAGLRSEAVQQAAIACEQGNVCCGLSPF